MVSGHSNLPLLIGLCAGTAAAVVLFIWANGESKPKKKKGRPPGLFNLGQTCFVNALLQAWASCRHLRGYLTKVIRSRQLSDGSLPPEVYAKSHFLVELNRLLTVLSSSESDTDSTEGLLNSLRSHRWNLSCETEQDCEELMNVFTTTIEEEIGPVGQVHSLLDVSQMEETITPASLASTQRQMLSVLSAVLLSHEVTRMPFRGLLATVLHCKFCLRKHVNHERFCILPLSLINFRSFTTRNTFPLTVETCLRKFFLGEIVYEVNCENCSKRSSMIVKRDFFKKQGVAKLPPCLVLQLQRVGWLPSGETVKIDDFVLFPEMLDMSDFLFYRTKVFQSRLTGGSDAGLIATTVEENLAAEVQSASLPPPLVAVDDVRYKYQLRSVVVHTGSANSGHFITYRRGTYSDQQWYFCSDTTVRKVSAEEVLGCQAYLLFYERILSPSLSC